MSATNSPIWLISVYINLNFEKSLTLASLAHSILPKIIKTSIISKHIYSNGSHSPNQIFVHRLAYRGFIGSFSLKCWNFTTRHFKVPLTWPKLWAPLTAGAVIEIWPHIINKIISFCTTGCCCSLYYFP